MYYYGMRLRPFSIGCQPLKGIVEAREDKSGKYWNILKYSRELSKTEVEDYELDFLGKDNEYDA